MKMKKIDIREVEGFLLGNADNQEAGTGVTAIISESGAVAGVDVKGGGPATRETDLLRSENTVDRIHAVVLSGGSAFGLEAASGVMRALSDKGIGFRVFDIPVPIVTGASLFDLSVGSSDVFPDVEMGIQAVANAYEGDFETGNRGAGTGASVGKIKGMDRAMKTGLGTFACGDDYIQVGAIAAVNAVGDIYNGAGNIIAGLRTSDGSSIQGTIRVLKGMIHEESTPEINLTDIRTMAAAEAIKRTAETDTASDKPADSRSEDSVQSEKDDIVKAMMQSYEQENSLQAVEESPNTSGTEDNVEDAYIYVPADEATVYTENVEAHAYEVPASEEKTPAVISHESSPVQFEEPADTEACEEPASETSEESASVVNEEAEEEDEEPENEDDGYDLTEEDKADMGYDIAFNTTISCVITNAVLTKSQANKLASILHDAYARAIKPVHSTLDGDTIFVMSTCTQNVNFDAFAALATDVLQYAIIDAASSAYSAYGLPASRDIIRK